MSLLSVLDAMAAAFFTVVVLAALGVLYAFVYGEVAPVLKEKICHNLQRVGSFVAVETVLLLFIRNTSYVHGVSWGLIMFNTVAFFYVLLHVFYKHHEQAKNIKSCIVTTTLESSTRPFLPKDTWSSSYPDVAVVISSWAPLNEDGNIWMLSVAAFSTSAPVVGIPQNIIRVVRDHAVKNVSMKLDT